MGEKLRSELRDAALLTLRGLTIGRPKELKFHPPFLGPWSREIIRRQTAQSDHGESKDEVNGVLH